MIEGGKRIVSAEIYNVCGHGVSHHTNLENLPFVCFSPNFLQYLPKILIINVIQYFQ